MPIPRMISAPMTRIIYLTFPLFGGYRPPKIRAIRIIENPFDDIVPRITVAEKKAQIQARIEAKKDADQREKRSRAKK